MEISGIEVYARTIAACETLALLENWRNQNPAVELIFRNFVPDIARHFVLNNVLTSLLNPPVPMNVETQSQGNPYFFGETVERLLKARRQLLPRLLMDTYSSHPPTAVEAYGMLRLGDVRDLIQKLGDAVSSAARYVRDLEGYALSRFQEDHNKHVDFILDQLAEFGIQADNYYEAAGQYSAMIARLFPQGEPPAQMDLVATISPIRRVAAVTRERR